MTLAARLSEGGVALGITLTIPDPFLAEAIAAEPFDFLMLDAEHAPASTYQLQTQLIALRTSSATLLVRVGHNDPETIGHMLDLGAGGVVVPQVETAGECERAVASALYPPVGVRGYGPRRAARLTDRATYLAEANQRTFVGIMIESQTGIDNLDEILAVAGLGGVIVGALDLSASLGHLNQPDHPDVVKAIDRIFERCLAAGVPFGMYAGSPATATALIARGARILTVGSDLMFLEQGMRRVVDGMLPVRESAQGGRK